MQPLIWAAPLYLEAVVFRCQSLQTRSVAHLDLQDPLHNCMVVHPGPEGWLFSPKSFYWPISPGSGYTYPVKGQKGTGFQWDRMKATFPSLDIILRVHIHPDPHFFSFCHQCVVFLSKTGFNCYGQTNSPLISLILSLNPHTPWGLQGRMH